MLKNYYALTKPGIVYGNLVTAGAGFLFASRRHFSLLHGLAFLFGTALVIAAACVFNNYLDRSIDQKMSRTKRRALVSGSIKLSHALSFASIIGIIGFVVLAATTNLLTVGVGAVGFLSYIFLYGYAKRRTVHGTLLGSISGAMPIVAGYTAVTGTLGVPALLLFLILVSWQMPHFFAIALFRMSDYERAAIPVHPLRRGVQRTKAQILGYIFTFIVASIALRVFGHAGWWYFGGSLFIGLSWFIYGLYQLRKLETTRWARQMFFGSLYVILGISVLISVARLLP